MRKIENLEGLINLKKIFLCANKISRIENLNHLKNLEHLELGDNKIRVGNPFLPFVNSCFYWIFTYNKDRQSISVFCKFLLLLNIYILKFFFSYRWLRIWMDWLIWIVYSWVKIKLQNYRTWILSSTWRSWVCR